MKTIQLIAILLFASISLDAQEPRTVQSNTQLQDSKNVEVKKELLDLNHTLQQDFATLESHFLNISKLNDEFQSTTQEYSEKLMNLIERNIASKSKQSDLVPILKEMKEIHNAYYRQYKNLQNAMQMESRQSNAISNAMKIKYDSEKAAINNIR